MQIKELSWLPSLLFIILSIFIFRVFSWNLANIDLAFDEAQYWSWSLALDWGYYSKPPFLAWLISLNSSICGISETCLRISSPFLYSLSTLFIASTAFVLCETNTKNRAAILAGILWLLIPGISLSSALISTDVPMLFFSSVAIWSFVNFFYSKENTYDYFYLTALTISVALGFLSKYAILFLLLAFVIFFFFNINFRIQFKKKLSGKKLVIFTVFLLILVFPHIWWNIKNGFITLQHTIANVNVGAENYNFYNVLIFFLEQFVVFGPINFLLFLFIISNYKKLSEKEKMLSFVALVPILIILIQAFISRAHANWAAVSYIPASISVALYIDRIWNKNGKIMYYFTTIFSLAVLIVLPFFAYYNFKLDPFKRMRGWKNLGEQISDIYSQYPSAILVADDRKVLAESIYYMRDRPHKWVRWNADGKIHDHYELVTKHEDLKNETGIMVSVEPNNQHFIKFFSDVRYLGTVTRVIGTENKKEYKIWLLNGYLSD